MFARWPKYGDYVYYRAFVIKATESTIFVRFDDGDTKTYERNDNSAVIHDMLSYQWTTSQRVIAFWPERTWYYPGKIDSMNGQHYHVKFDDGDVYNELDYQMRPLPS